MHSQQINALGLWAETTHLLRENGVRGNFAHPRAEGVPELKDRELGNAGPLQRVFPCGLDAGNGTIRELRTGEQIPGSSRQLNFPAAEEFQGEAAGRLRRR